MSIYPYLLSETQLRMYVLNITVWRVFEKFLRKKLFLVQFQAFSFQAHTFEVILPGSQFQIHRLGTFRDP